ncbi:MAG: M43 family zinc metalloprotease [Planctomycetota bacterium]
MSRFRALSLTLLPLASPALAQVPDIEGCDQSPSPEEVSAYKNMVAGSPSLALAGATDYWVPVRWHIVRQSGGIGGFPLQFVDDSMADLNAAFATSAPLFDFGRITFFQGAPVDFIDDTDLLAIQTSMELEQLKAIRPTVNAVDIYVIDSFPGALGLTGVGELAGISSFTVSQAAGIAPGIVVTGARIHPADLFWSPALLAHEMGHYLDLFHVFETAFGVECTGQNCGDPGTGDLVCDTAATPLLIGSSVSTVCSYTGGGNDPCNQPYGSTPATPTDNFMNAFNTAKCMGRFTTEQNAKMIKSLLFVRNDTDPILFPNPPLPDTGRLPILTAYPGNDCNGNGVLDADEIDSGAAADCNQNFIPDDCEVALGWEPDLDGDGVLDSCETVCQADLGFQGPGNLQLSICGLDLTGASSVADAVLSGGAPDGAGWFLFSLSANPTPFGLGTMVPLPFLVEPLEVQFDGDGTFTYTLNGGAGPPFTFYLQGVVQNAGLYELSNALEVVTGT